MHRAILSGLLLASAGYSAVTYTLRDARFFGTNPGRETTQSGVFTASSSESLPANYSTGGATPTVFTGLATNQGMPFRLGAYNQVNAGESVDLTSNLDLVTPLPIASLSQSRITATMTVTGGTGTAYLLPTFRIQGTFTDNHSTAVGGVQMCAGISACTLSGVASSSGGVENIDELFTPNIGANTAFTFGTPFSLFFFVGASVTTLTGNALAPGSVTVDLTNGMELVALRVVDENGDLIRGAVIDSDLADILNTPEPATWGLMAAAVAVMAVNRRFRRPSSCRS
ncbi:MAG: PEP-CTERM sorting domain-containing protein [Bryobacterales bacterium]|nr:PEP-CTERM sorting domain-containing protein [Bryobacterales bacterium]